MPVLRFTTIASRAPPARGGAFAGGASLLLAAGHTNRQIGKALFLAVGAAQARGLLAAVPPSSLSE